MENFLQNFIQENSIRFNQKLECHIKLCLSKMGFEFITQEDFLNFCYERIQIIIQGDIHTFYLDHVNIIGGYDYKPNFSMEGFTAKCSINYNFF